ncbi:tRNA lysidine(34) synthetase TilS [Chachezhania sediminis]|uniref:tRNA lysidine(34) synthetase TilS n=1 Tax=Chachezhania sediminis TaxID=2599291 RepID=UPI00131EAB44|nr:tRNA lysidine(34) synthetase TilS [Chachezhania sediminis]
MTGQAGDRGDPVDRLRAALGLPLPPAIGVAVSGGGDSLALLHLLVRALDGTDVRLRAATVDHGLRPEAAAEAAHVAALARKLGVEHDMLHWNGGTASGNLQGAARQARYRLLTRWAHVHDLPELALGHTMDDQAETVLMRLGRASGVDGLAAMAATREVGGVLLIRPLLTFTRTELRDHLRRAGIGWCEDPSNDDSRFARVRARQALPDLASLGVDALALSEVAANMARAKQALDWAARQAAHAVVTVDGGDLIFGRRALADLPEEIARRLLAAALAWIAGPGYPPRRAPLAELAEAVKAGERMTLGGCLLLPEGDRARLCRELKAVAGLDTEAGALWDGRWIFEGPVVPGARVQVLGPEGLRQVKTWRDTRRPREALMASPALWLGGKVLSAPLAGLPGRHVLTSEGRGPFSSFPLSH